MIPTSVEASKNKMSLEGSMQFFARGYAARGVAVMAMFRLAVLALAVVASSAAEAGVERKSHATMVIDFIDTFLEQRLAALGEATGQLSSSLNAFCADPAGKDLKPIEGSFAATVKAWGALDFIRFGPIMNEHRLERFYFWPDPRGTTARQLAMLLAKRDPAVLTPENFTKQSVAVQGLSALEILIYDQKAPLGATDEAGRYRCQFAMASAAGLDRISHEVIDGWKGPAGFRAKMLSPGSDNALYKDASETARDVVKSFVTGIELGLNRFATPELAAAKQTPPKRVRVPFERSGLSTAFLSSGIQSLRALLDVTAMIAYVPPDKAWMKAFLPTAFKGLDVGIESYEKTRSAEPGSEERMGVIHKLRFDLSGLRQIVVKELAPAADLTLGFNELDGD
jgi:predicted lipoprotein